MHEYTVGEVCLDNPLLGNLLKKDDARGRGYIGVGITPKGLLLCAFILGRRPSWGKTPLLQSCRGDPSGRPLDSREPDGGQGDIWKRQCSGSLHKTGKCEILDIFSISVLPNIVAE